MSFATETLILHPLLCNNAFLVQINMLFVIFIRGPSPATNNYFDLNVATYKKVWTNFELGICLIDSYGNK